MSRAIEPEQVGIGPLADEPKVPTEQAEGAVVGVPEDVALAIAGLQRKADYITGSACSVATAELRTVLAFFHDLYGSASHQAATPASVSPGTEGRDA